MAKCFNSTKPIKLINKTTFLHGRYKIFSKYDAEPDLFESESLSD